MIVGTWFEHQETLKGYYHIFHQSLVKHGIPFLFYTDRRTVLSTEKGQLQPQGAD